MTLPSSMAALQMRGLEDQVATRLPVPAPRSP
jgi:hypothetical protein